MKSSSLPRRDFLRNATLLAVGGAGISLPATSARAIERIQRVGGPKFKFSLAAYSYRDLLTGSQPVLTLHDFVDECASMNLEGTELTSYYFPENSSGEFLRDLKRHCFRLGLDISGTAVGNDFCHPPGEKRDQEMASVKAWIDRAEILGAPVIRIFSGHAHEGQSEQEAQRLAVEAMEEACHYAGEHGVFLALENHGGLTATADGMLALVRDVASPWFGVNLDTGNFHGDDVYGELVRLAPYALNVQVKVVVRPADGVSRPSDFRRLASILEDVGYRGYIVLEYEEDEDPREACPRYVEQLRQAFLT